MELLEKAKEQRRRRHDAALNRRLTKLVLDIYPREDILDGATKGFNVQGRRKLLGFLFFVVVAAAADVRDVRILSANVSIF